MVSPHGPARGKPVAIAPAPVGGSHGDSSESPQPVMHYTCQPCAKRKVKCNKVSPTCSSCRKANLECVYQAPQPRWRKRKLSGDVLERLARYEGILREHNLLDAEPSPSVGEAQPQDPVSLHWNEPEPSGKGTLVAGEGKSRYIDSNLWCDFGDGEIQPASDDEYEDQEMSDPLTGAFMGSEQSILQYHPTHAKAMVLWTTHVDTVEPICKILHIPSTAKMVERVSQKPELASRTDECLLFSIYHFAVFAMTDEECIEKLGHTRATLRQRYHFAARQALVNASFLKTTEMSVLQAYVLFLMSCRYEYDSQTYWILTGVAVRIAQRMGLHRDGEKLSLPPFEVQMRRRLFYQLIPLEGVASQMSGAGIAIPADAWDTKQPLNVDDDQIWPGMTEPPEEQQRATEMVFCLTRTCIGKFVVKAGKPAGKSWTFKDVQEAELAIGEAEREVEEKYIRYCDIVNPLHFLAMGLARCGITAMRMRVRLPKARNKTATDAEQRELLQLARKIIDTDAAVCSNAGLRKYRWHIRPFSIWGMWDSLIFLLTSLCTRLDLFSPAEVDAEWKRVQQVYQNHSEVLESKRALFVAFGRLTLKAWVARPASDDVPEPAFIFTLYSLQTAKTRRKEERSQESGDITSFEPSPMSGEDGCGMGLDLGDALGDCPVQGELGNKATVELNFSLDAEDWIFWDQLIHEHQAQV